MDPMGNVATGEEETVIDIGDTPLETENFTVDKDSANLVLDFMAHPEGRKALKEIVTTVFEDFDSDWESNSEFRSKTAKNMALFNGFLPKKTFPWQDSANAHVPILLENVLRLWSRIEGEVFGDWTEVCGAIGVSPLDDDEAEIITMHSNWQLREDIPDFARQMRRAGYAFLLIGDFTVHSYWDPERKQNCHETLMPDEFVTPFAFVSTKPDYSDLPHYTKILRYYRHQVEARRDEWADVDEVLEQEPMGWADPEPIITRETSEVTGQSIPEEISRNAPYVILQYEGWIKLPFEKKQDWCQVLVDYNTRRPLMLRVHEEGDWRDIERFNQQAQQMEAYRQSVIQNEMASQQVRQQGQELISQAAGDAPGYQAALSQKLEEGIPEIVPPPLPPPTWLSNPSDLGAMPEPVRKVPIYMFTHGVCHEPMTGGLGFGPGRMLADYNRVANVAISQFADATTLNNANMLIVADGVDFDRPFSCAPGKINKAKVSGQELKNSVMPFQPGPPSAGLIEIVKLMQASGQAAAQSPEVLGGAAGKSGETYRGIATRIEQATRQISVIGRAFADSIRNVLQNNAKLNSVFLPDDQIMRVTSGVIASMGDPAAPPPQVTKEMYRRNYRIEIRSDLMFKADAERISEADEVLAMAMKIPPLAQDPPFVYAAIKASLEARHRRDLIPLLGPPPPATGAPFNMMAPPQMVQNVPSPPQNPPENQQGNPGGPQPAPGPIGPGGPRPNNPQGPGGPAPGPPPPGPSASPGAPS